MWMKQISRSFPKMVEKYFFTILTLLRGETLKQYLEGGKDNILLLRLLAATMVLLGHSYALLGINFGERDPVRQFFGVIYTHFIGLMMFFAISGYLITLSWQRKPCLLRFLRARLLRIFPALTLCVSVCALVLGPLLTMLPLAAYLRSSTPYAYIAGNATLLQLQWQLPGLFAHNPMTDYVNGSLWTLPVEASLYFIVAALGLVALLRRRWLANIAIVSLVIATFVWRKQQPWESTDLQLIIICFFYFGMLCCINRDYVPISTALLLILVGFCWIVGDTALYRIALAFLIAYFCLWFSYVPRLPSLESIGDGSYGLYLWGFPIQQTLIATMSVTSPLMLFSLSLPISLAFGLASWHCIEKRALRWKQI